MMEKVKEDPERENRISDEIIVDAYGEEEQSLGWYNYLDEKLTFPFTARCIKEREISPLEKGETVQVIDMASEDESLHEMFVKILWKGKTLAVPLSQLNVLRGDGDTRQAVEDWHYWVNRGYQL